MISRSLFFFISLVVAVVSQEIPNPRLELNQFNYSTTFRQNFCERYQDVANGRVSLINALKGYEITSMLTMGDTFLKQDKMTGALKEDYPGIAPVLMDEVCARAGCTWRNSYSVIPEPEEGKTWSELLVWVIETYDLGVDWWMASIDRMSSGAAFTEPWYDAGLIMIAKKPESDKEFSMWTFMLPFDNSVWLMLVVTTFVSGLVYYFLELLNPKADKQKIEDDPIEASFLVAVTLTSHYGFKPRTNPARLLAFSVAFFALVVGASYTANLASFLVISNQATFAFNTLEEVVRVDKAVCVYGGTNADEVVTQAFPLARIVRVAGNVEVLESVRDGQCDVGISTVAAWNEYKRSSEITGGCGLEWVGRAFVNIPAGFVTKADSGEFCTNLVRDVVSIHMAKMAADGFLAEAWKDHLNHASNDQCYMAQTETDDGSGQLTLTNMGGIFAFHAMLMSASLLLALYAYFTDGSKAKKRLKENRRKSMQRTSNDETFDGEDVEDDEASQMSDVDMERIRREVHRVSMTQKRDMETIDLKLQMIMSLLSDLGADRSEMVDGNKLVKVEENGFSGSIRTAQNPPSSADSITYYDATDERTIPENRNDAEENSSSWVPSLFRRRP